MSNLLHAKEALSLLEEKNFVRRLENKDKKIKTKYLYEFETKLRLLDEYDFKVLVDVYIKICFIDNFTLVVSFHEKEF